MTTLNVQELFEKFMQDPEYIGKEELALAEAQQRVIQHMNNTKALSMAKMDSPVDNLLNFLLPMQFFLCMPKNSKLQNY